MDEVLECLKYDIQIHGFSKQRIELIDPIASLKADLSDWLRAKVGIKDTNECILDKIHELMPFRRDADANSITLEVIQHLSAMCRFDEIIYKSCPSHLQYLVGSDIHSQRSNNIVIQHPGSLRIAELHIDAEPTSKFEIVCWIPLVDCYETKSFYIVPKKYSLRLIRDYKEGRYSSWSEFKNDALKHIESITIDYGEILYFSSCLLHGSEVNQTNETRWAINTRFKNLFAPIGLHDPISYYRILRMSPVTKTALEFNDN